MATRTYTRTGGTTGTVNPRQLADNIATALGRTGVTCDVVNATTLAVSQATLAVGDDATVNGAITAYAFDPAWDQQWFNNLQNIIATLNSWADDAANTFNNWGTLTAAQKDTAMKVSIQREGIIARRLGDFLRVTGQGS